jgi:hypothetical protein
MQPNTSGTASAASAPYLYGRLDMLELVKRAFGAVELERLEVGKGFHVEARRIGILGKVRRLVREVTDTC